MRLLHLDKNGRLFSTDFSGKIPPPYAILSHRWDSDNEVIFEDIGNETCKSKAGYRKIEFCAQQAAQDQLRYFWIDTCCIDKWNLHERSQAINSMFQWYKNAAKCYIFLSDVSMSTTTDARHQRPWEASFRASEWFTRGWTLQELIAPVSADFFSCEGRRLGDKRSLEQLIHEVTSIPVEALQGCNLDNFSVSERMAWARDRETTEEEDGAYCLLGIFGIRIPLTYGEGKEKALSRLQEEVEAASTTPSIIPFSRNDRFVGREPQLAQLEAKLFGGKQASKLAITGEGGMGKSQLALELAYRVRQTSKSCSVFWVDASDKDSLYQSYTGIAQKLDIPGWDNEHADVKKLVQLYLSSKSAGQWLLICDNAGAGSPGLSSPPAASLVEYIPLSELGSVIFTTADSITAESLASHNIIELQEMTPDAAQRMLEMYLSNLVVANEQQEARFLLRTLSYLPLAIVQAAAYIKVNKITITDYRSLLVKHNRVDKLSSRESKDMVQYSSVNDSVATTWLISMEQIRRDHPSAADYLFFMACVDQKDIPLDLLPLVPSGKKDDAVGILGAYALITRRPADSAVDVHRLVHLAIRDWLHKQELLGKWAQKAITRLLEVFPDNDHGNRSKWRRLIPHAKYALSRGLTGQNEGPGMDLEWKIAMTLHSDGQYNEAEELFGRGMESRKRVLGAEHPDTLTSMANLASTYRNQGRWKEAEELQAQELQLCSKVLGEEHPDTLISMENLARIWKSQNRDKQAIGLLSQCARLRERKLGADHPYTKSSLQTLKNWQAGQDEVELLDSIHL
jgi:tetratricopeptide (TPR) repeat protein